MNPSPAFFFSFAVAMLTTFMFGWTNGSMNSPAPVIRAALGLTHDRARPARDVV
jgi:hypothetical protein